MPPRQLWGPSGAQRPLVQNWAWQTRFNALFNRTNITPDPYPYRRIDTAEDALDLLHDVEEDIKRGKGQHTAPQRAYGEIESSSKEQWPPQVQDSAHLTSSGREEHPHVRIPTQAADLPPHHSAHPSRQHLIYPPETATQPVLDSEPQCPRVRLPYELLALPAARPERFNTGAEAFSAVSSADDISVDDEHSLTTNTTGSKARNHSRRGTRGRGQRLKRSGDGLEDGEERHTHKKRAKHALTDTKTSDVKLVSRSNLDDMEWSNTSQRLSPPPQWDEGDELDAGQVDGKSKKRRLQEDAEDSHADKHHERRRQKLRKTTPEDVDRYVTHSSRAHRKPESKTISLQLKKDPKSKESEPMNPPASFAGFTKLPDDLRDKILTILLKSDDTIELNPAELLPFITKHASIHTAEQIQKSGVYMKRPAVVRSQLERMKSLLAVVPHDQWRGILTRPHTGGLTLSLMRVSKEMHERAARIMYGSNTFHFSNVENAWMHLQSFLTTVGASNAGHIRHIRLPAPRWYRGISRDAIAGTLLDVMNPATYLAVPTMPVNDRLLSAVEACTRALIETGNLESMQVDISFPVDVLHFIGERSQDYQHPIHPSEEKDQVLREAAGMEALKQLSDALSPGNKPVLVMYAVEQVNPRIAKKFRSHLAKVIRVATNYGWAVDQYLREPARVGSS